MRLKRTIAAVFLLFSAQLFPQKSQDVLFTVDNEQITTSEFLTVFNKNRDIVEDENKKTIEEYLELYINYKLKLKQAYELKLDTVASYKSELEKYRAQLIAPYLKDDKVTEALVKEAYDRLKTEVSASHILVRLNPKAKPADTLIAYTKITEARNKIIAGAPFDQVAKGYSEDPSAQKNGGNMGYFTTFAMVYPFENAAYNNKIGDVSMPFKTSFGYHIVKVNDKRPSKGEVEVAHIMIKNNPADTTFAEKQIKEVYAKLNQGDAFDFLARQYSDDKNTAARGGKMAKFSASRMVQSFSDIAFSLKNESDISKPFKTDFGWHIVKLLKKYPVKDFNELEENLTQKIAKSQRVAIVGKSIAEGLKKQYTIKVNEDNYNAYMKNDTALISNNISSTIFTINEKNVLLQDLIDYDKSQNKKTLKTAYEDFLNEEILNYYKENLEHTDAGFAATIKEYRDGLLLFDLLQEKIWTKAEKDTLALANFFDENRSNYKWKERANLTIATCTHQDKAALVKQLLEQGQTTEEIKTAVNEGATINVLFSKGVLEAGDDKLPQEYTFTTGVSQVYNDDKNHFVIISVRQVIEPSLKELKEAKGLVINDFQNELESNWTSELRDTYKVKVKKKVLKRIINENEN